MTETWWGCERWGAVGPPKCPNPNCNQGHEIDEDGDSVGRCTAGCQYGFMPIGVPDADCVCTMCQAARFDRLTPAQRKKNPGMRPRPTTRT
jgi:hypothetical protein